MFHPLTRGPRRLAVPRAPRGPRPGLPRKKLTPSTTPGRRLLVASRRRGWFSSFFPAAVLTMAPAAPPGLSGRVGEEGEGVVWGGGILENQPEYLQFKEQLVRVNVRCMASLPSVQGLVSRSM
ncbi:hypothetical protein ZWY2020_014104 [Hordeum vulgare]|nr:hypothetical protein ZWY2020_014104 [Hordeum vulgare]